ncbi:hypothetical protein [Kitasatospora sp. NBC_00315]|uniref:hypothetical protein n=1 Tax=Kitasatospora sp. NBC_00315 TaxID=2975963 RepID=UPI00324BEF16
MHAVAVTVLADARIRLRRLRPLRWALAGLGAVLGGRLLLSGAPGTDGAVLGVLAAGGWALGLLPVHADPRSTGPSRRSGEHVTAERSPADHCE